LIPFLVDRIGAAVFASAAKQSSGATLFMVAPSWVASLRAR
jgi:hypothetical protein